MHLIFHEEKFYGDVTLVFFTEAELFSLLAVENFLAETPRAGQGVQIKVVLGAQ